VGFVLLLDAFFPFILYFLAVAAVRRPPVHVCCGSTTTAIEAI